MRPGSGTSSRYVLVAIGPHPPNGRDPRNAGPAIRDSQHKYDDSNAGSGSCPGLLEHIYLFDSDLLHIHHPRAREVTH